MKAHLLETQILAIKPRLSSPYLWHTPDEYREYQRYFYSTIRLFSISYIEIMMNVGSTAVFFDVETNAHFLARH